jgi:hypothetical protein
VTPLDRAAANRAAVVDALGVDGAILGGFSSAVGTEADRILAIPRVVRTPETDKAAAARWSRLLRRSPSARPLRPVQGSTLDALAREAALGTPYGVFGAIGVGHGKTLIAMLAGAVAGAERPLYLHPPAMRSQWRHDVDEWSREYDFRPPRSMAYSELSQASASTFLDYHAPDLVIADEAHALRYATSARTKRVARYLREHPECRVMLLSGTITGRSLLDHAHLLEWVLRDRTPLPLSRIVLEKWASVIDPGGWPDHDSLSSIWPLARAHGAPSDYRTLPLDLRQKTAREGYRSRFVTVPGVVTTTDGSVGSSLTLVAREPAGGVPDVIDRALRGLVERWELPSNDAAGNPIDVVGGEHGEELVDAARLAAAASNVSAGFFYRWAWPNGTPTEVERSWLERRREYHREVRDALRYAEAGRDSPLLIARWLHAGGGGDVLRLAWKRWHAAVGPDHTSDSPYAGMRYSDLEPPPVVPVWLSDYLVRDVLAVVAEARAARTKEDRALLVWYGSRAMEAALRAGGVPVFGAGSDSPPDDLEVAACSIAVHGKGKNLQRWSRNLIVEPPAGGSVWEQLLGRTHRQGQQADEVTAIVYQHTDRTRAAVDTATADARYIEQTQGTRQKLCYARWREGSDTDPDTDATPKAPRPRSKPAPRTALPSPIRVDPGKIAGVSSGTATATPSSAGAARARRALGLLSP